MKTRSWVIGRFAQKKVFFNCLSPRAWAHSHSKITFLGGFRYINKDLNIYIVSNQIFLNSQGIDEDTAGIIIILRKQQAEFSANLYRKNRQIVWYGSSRCQVGILTRFAHKMARLRQIEQSSGSICYQYPILTYYSCNVQYNLLTI